MCYLQVNERYDAGFPLNDLCCEIFTVVVRMPLEEVQLSERNSVMPCAFSNFLGLIFTTVHMRGAVFSSLKI